jgi:hypothetical protein
MNEPANQEHQTPNFTIAKRGFIQTVLALGGLCCARPERGREDKMSVRKTANRVFQLHHIICRSSMYSRASEQCLGCCQALSVIAV